MSGERKHDYIYVRVGISKQKARTKSPLNAHKLKTNCEKMEKLIYINL